jgi:hypothetical protein
MKGLSMNHIILVILALVLTACASTPASFAPEHSFAKNVTDAAGWDVDDIRRRELKNAEFIESDGKLTRATTATGTVAGLTGATSYILVPSVSLALEWLAEAGPSLGLFFLANALEPAGVAEKYQVLAWLPDDGQMDEEAAMKAMATMQFNAIRDLPEPYKSKITRDVERRGGFIIPDHYSAQVAVEGGICDDPRLSCVWPLIVYEPERSLSPVWLGGDPAFLFFTDTSYGAGAGPTCITVRGTKRAEEFEVLLDRCQQDLNVLEVAMTANAPEWFFVYRPRLSSSHKMPILANRGELYFFVSDE